MNTPIFDFIREYAYENKKRLHMPGHKGSGLLGFEEHDITEINGADSLYEADGIIKESEKNASRLFGCDTFYSAEGSSQCIRAMVYLASLYAKKQSKKPVIAAGRNAHKTFFSAAALCNIDVTWLYSKKSSSYLSCEISADELDDILSNADEKPIAVYLTNPDYLGNLIDIKAISSVCKKYGTLLLVDNAHGAYLKFLSPSKHPIDLGADMCCDSAHKTLPALTGAAYLHISNSANPYFLENAKSALSLFGSTSPSYLILESLDALNPYLLGYGQKLNDFILKVRSLKAKLISGGFTLKGDEEIKITIAPKGFGYSGEDLAQILTENNIVPEFFDPDYLTLMLTPEIGNAGLLKLEKALLSVKRKPPITDKPPLIPLPKKAMSPNTAYLKKTETLPVSHCLGKVLALGTVGCPPAVPIVVSGEEIDENVIKAANYYGIKNFTVVKS